VLGLAWSPNREVSRRLLLDGDNAEDCGETFSGRFSRRFSGGFREAIVFLDNEAKAASGLSAVDSSFLLLETEARGNAFLCRGVERVEWIDRRAIAQLVLLVSFHLFSQKRPIRFSSSSTYPARSPGRPLLSS